MNLAPVVVFAYNRPAHLQRTLDALASCRLSDGTHVHVFSDGPRNTAAESMVEDVRRVLADEEQAKRFASLTVHAAAQNLGLAESIIRGVGQVLGVHDRVIVLEDDLLVAGDFLEFMNDCLDFYQDDSAVGAITGFCPLTTLPLDYTKDVLLMQRNSSQGWGTWSRVWKDVDWIAAGHVALEESWALRQAFNREGNDRYDRLRRQLEGRIDSWSIRFGLSLFLRGLGTIYPAVNRIGNIGYDGTGVHSGVGNPKNEYFSEAPYNLQRVETVPSLQRAFRRTYSGTWPRRTWRDLLARCPRVATWLGR